MEKKPDNVGQPPAGAEPSGPQTVDQLLGTHGACSFALVLHTHVKTTNGRGTLDGLEVTSRAPSPCRRRRRELKVLRPGGIDRPAGVMGGGDP